MPLLNELKESDLLRIFIMGEPGTGKTIFGTSFPGRTKAYDFDGKLSSAYNHWKGIDATKLERIDYENCVPFDTKGGAYVKMADSLAKLIEEYNKTKVLPFENLLIDSTTVMAEEMLQWMLEFESGIKRPSISKVRKIAGQQDYGVFAPLFRDFIFKIFSVPWNVVMTGHIAVKQDEKTGEISRTAAIPGRMSKQFGIYFNEIYRSYVEGGKYMIQTKADHYYSCRSQIPRLPNPVELKYEELIKKR